MDFTIKNYRCFPDSRPARLTVRPGFTAFVGTNNAGKSSLLRFFYEFRGLFRTLSNPNILVRLFRGESSSFNPATSMRDLADLFCDSNGRDLTIELELFMHGVPGRGRVKLVITVHRPRNVFTTELFLDGQQTNPSGKGRITLSGDTLFEFPTGTLLIQSPLFRVEFSQFINACEALAGALYIGPFRNAINVGTREDYFDIQVGQSFVQSWKAYKTGPSRSQNEAAWRLSEDIARVFEFDRLEINPSPDDQTLQVFVNGKSYVLNEIGSGLTQFVIVLANAAIKRPTYILIDEPELNLHPSLQIDFLTTLGSYAERGVIFSTHSMGLARASAERVYAVRRLGQSESEVAPLESLPRLSEFVGELGFSGYKELGFEQILLVEGPTEVRTMQQFLRFLKKEHQIVMVNLGGASLINGARELELHELKRISPRITAIIDSERPAAGAQLDASRLAFQETCRTADILCYFLDRRATENYLSDNAIKKVKGPKYRALSEFEKLEGPNPSWSKSESWRIAREMDINDLRGTDLLRHLESL